MSRKAITKEDVIQWLKENASHINLLEWGGKSTSRSKFVDTNRNVEFVYSFSLLKNDLKKNPNRLFGASRKEILEKRKKTNLKKYGVEHVLQNEKIRKKVLKTNLERWGTENPMSLNSVKKKLKNTFIEKYGVDNPNKTKEVRDKIDKTNIKKYGNKTAFQKEKIKKTNLERYGVEFPIELDKFKKKTKETNLKRFGVESPTQNEKVKQKIKQTNLERYGVDNPSKNKQFRNKAKQTNLERYGVEYPIQLDKFKKKVKETNLDRFGVESPARNEKIKQKIKQTNLERYGVEWSLQNKDVISKGIETRKRKGQVHVINGKTLKEIAKEKGIAHSTARTIHLNYNKDFLQNYELGKTKIEQEIEEFLKSLNIEYVRDRSLQDSRYRPDFFIPSHNLIIECDGLYWHSETNKDNKNYHKTKKEIYNSLGYDSLFFREDEILNKKSVVKSIILNKLKLSTRVGARKTKVIEISKKEARHFFDQNHLMGNGSGRTYGLQFSNKIIAAIQIRWKSKDKKILDISRFCTKNKISVVGGFSKLLKFIEKQEKPNQIMTFIDLRYGKGNYLSNLDFQKMTDHISFYWTDYRLTFHRMKFRGSSGYNYGLVKIWDCGQAKFVKKCQKS